MRFRSNLTFAASSAGGHCNFVLTHVASRILGFEYELACSCRGSHLNLKSAIGRRDRFATAAFDGHARIGFAANQINTAAEKFTAEIRNRDLRAAAWRHDKLQRIAPITGLAARGCRSHAPEVNTRTQIACAELSRHELIALDDFSVRNEERRSRDFDAIVRRRA